MARLTLRPRDPDRRYPVVLARDLLVELDGVEIPDLAGLTLYIDQDNYPRAEIVIEPTSIEVDVEVLTTSSAYVPEPDNSS